jgi:hypothetical protein
MALDLSTGSRIIMTTSLLVAMELFLATQKLLDDVGAQETVAKALGIPQHLVDDVKGGRMLVTMEDVTHWIAHFALRRHYPSLHGYTNSDAAGNVVSSLELLIRGG